MTTYDEHVKNVKYIVGLTTTPYYKATYDHLVRVMRLTRSKKIMKSPAAHWGVQKGLVLILEELEPLITQGRKLAKRDAEEAKNLKETADINRIHSGCYREIADGLAWRTLGYKRIRLRILAQAQSPGLIATPQGPKDGRKAEIKYAENVVLNKHYVLLHDITSCLLVGDLSLLKNIGAIPHLADAKSKKLVAGASILRKIDKNAKLNKQESKLFEAQMNLEQDKIYSGGEVVNVFHFSKPVVHFHQEVQETIKEARKTGFAAKRLANYLVVEVTEIHHPKLNLDEAIGKSLLTKTKNSMPFSNYDNLEIRMKGKVMRVKAPYSVYPYDDKDVIGLITGELYLHAEIDVDKIKSALQSYGWELELDIPDDVKPANDADYFGGEELFNSIGNDEHFITLKHVESGFIVQLGMDWLCRIAYEFISLESLMDPIEERRKLVVSEGKSVQGYAYVVNDEEDGIWR